MDTLGTYMHLTNRTRYNPTQCTVQFGRPCNVYCYSDSHQDNSRYPCGATPPTRLVGGSAGEQCLKDKAKVETNQAISWLEVTTLAQLERNLMSKKNKAKV